MNTFKMHNTTFTLKQEDRLHIRMEKLLSKETLDMIIASPPSESWPLELYIEGDDLIKLRELLK